MAAEQLIAEGGVDALSVRSAAEAAGTSTRAVYSLFGSRDGLVAAVAAQTFEVLAEACAGVPVTDDPRQDLIELGVRAFRSMVSEHPARYRIAFQRVAGLEPDAGLLEARERARVALQFRVQRLAEAGLLGVKTIPDAMLELEAMFEGLANTELRGAVLPIMATNPERAWRAALATVLRGFTATE